MDDKNKTFLVGAFVVVVVLFLIFGGGMAPGKEILHPLAVVVLGGILTSTLLDQIVTPAVFYKFGKPAADRMIAEREGRGETAGVNF